MAQEREAVTLHKRSRQIPLKSGFDHITDHNKINFQFSIFNFQFTNSRRSEGGIAPVSGLNHHARHRIFEKSRKPPQTLTFSALPNAEKSSIPRSDHMFDHLQKNLIFLPFRGVAKVVSRIVRDDEIAGSSPVTSTKKQPKTSYFYLFSAVFLYIFHKIGCFQLTTCSPNFLTFYWIFHGFFSPF